MSSGQALWLGNRTRTARERYVGQVRKPFKFHEICDHNLTAPHCSVCSIACTVGCDTNHWPAQPMFSQYARDMSVMVLDANFLCDVRVKCVFRCQVFGM